MAQGCRVLAIDFDEAKLKIALPFGAQTCNPSKGEDPVAAGLSFSRGNGVDGVIITASTSTSEPIHQAAQMSRKRGRIVMVGVTGMELNRADFYEKELTFQVSCSYGPGRYDPKYEQQGQDYPLSFVRWTENRNFQAILDLMASRKIDVSPLISKHVPFENAPDAYDLLIADKSTLGVLLTYQEKPRAELETRNITFPNAVSSGSAARCGFIGAGNYAARVLIPAFQKAGAGLQSIVTSGGTSGAIQARKFGFSHASTDTSAVFDNAEINTVVVATRHDSHARYVVQALKAGKNVFVVEKPLAITLSEVDAVERLSAGGGRARRTALDGGLQSPLRPPCAHPEGADRQRGGTQGVHHDDECRRHSRQSLDPGCGSRRGTHHRRGLPLYRPHAVPGGLPHRACRCAAPWRRRGCAGGGGQGGNHTRICRRSFGTIHYLANGAKEFPKERIEVFCAGRTLQIDNFRKLIGYGWPGFRKAAAWKQDKGQDACAAAFVSSIVEGREAPIPASDIFEVARITIEAAEQLRAQT